MKLDTPEVIQKPSLFEEYIEMQTRYVCQMTGKSREEVIPKVQQIVNERYKPKKVKILRSTSYGNVKYEELDLWKFIKSTEKYMLVPAGSVYKPPYQTKSIISQMVVDKLAERKKIKKIQLQAEGAGDLVLANRCWYQQATIKINCNSLPGGFGSPYNIFYDKPNYNTITSTARCMISRAYTTCEQLLGGNFAWFSVEELINFIILNIRHMPCDEQIDVCMKKYKLFWPTKEQLYNFYSETIKQYCPVEDLTPIKELVDKLNKYEITFLYYYCNLRHIMWDNEKIFKPFIKYVMDISDVKIDNNVTKDDAFAIDDTVVTVTTVAFGDKLGNFGIVDICKDHPEYIPQLVAYSKATEVKLHMLDLLFDTFVNTYAEIPEFQKKPMTWRNTTIVSDTDSVIFSADAWDDWYREGKPDVTFESYQIASLVIYWLHHSVKYALKRFSIAYGVTGKGVDVLAMKNEFLYPVMMIYDKKKTYIGIQKVKEGVILPKPKPDVKGQTLRGSSICTKSLDFSEDMMINKILKPVMNGRISGMKLIQSVIDFENDIIKSIQNQSPEFLKITSLKFERDYKDPDTQSVIVALRFWQECFAHKYGDIHPPTKVHIFKTVYPGDEYYENLKKTSPKIYKKIINYLNTHGKLPEQIIINPMEHKIPEELLPLIDVRHIIWHNTRPIYNTLSRLNIAVGCEKQELLLSDIY